MARHSGILLFSAVATLVVLGLIMLTSTTVWTPEMRNSDDVYASVKRQAVWMGLGVFFACLLSMIDYRRLQSCWLWLFLGVCVLLSFCYVDGIRYVNYGEGRWVKFPGLPVIQPSEFAKPIVVLALACWYAQYQAEAKCLVRGFLVPGLLLGGPCLLILFERDLGTTMVLGAVGGGLMFVAGSRISLLGLTAGIAALGGYKFVQSDPVRSMRLTAFWNMDDPEIRAGAGYQLAQGLKALQNGGWFGTGVGNGTAKLGALPFANNDFIFAALGEELGLVFSLLVVSSFVLIVISGLAIAIYAREFHGKILAAGLTMIIVVPAMLNIGVVTGSLPVTGLPLPFMSQGGSNLFCTLVSVGLLFSVHRRCTFIETTELARTKERKFALKL
ncbi:MAG: FtsW/RodA/SpoVE family cell cycle protein [Verrucomicrobiota bacterium JB023]|nr:FtsW/RodA/SpoVE family cell cycle protein [Verrucomicrobiota bacterium JB023]